MESGSSIWVQWSIQLAGSTNGRLEYLTWTDTCHQIIRIGVMVQYIYITKENPPKQLKNALITTFIHFLPTRLGWTKVASICEGRWGEPLANADQVLLHWGHQHHRQSLESDWELGRFFLWGFAGRDGRTGATPGHQNQNQPGSQVETEEVLGSLRSPGGRNCRPWARCFPLWNARWLFHDFVSLYKEFCQENSDHCSLGSPGVAVASPLLFALHAGSFGVWACECVSCVSVKYLKREKDFSNRLSVLFPTYICLSSVER